MTLRRPVAFAVMLVLAVGLCPGLALAATSGDLQAADSNLAAQDATDLGQCTIRFTDKNHVCDDGADWQMYYAKGNAKYYAKAQTVTLKVKVK